MARELVVVGLGGSVAAPSRSLAALKLAHESAQQAGATTELFDLQQVDLPFYDPTARRPGRAAQQLLEAAHRADGMIWSSPLYQGTISGRPRGTRLRAGRPGERRVGRNLHSRHPT